MGVITTTMAATPFLKGREGACVINLSSSAAYMGGTAYGDRKLAVSGLTITFSKELGPHGVRVNAISPGMILTDTIKSELPEPTKAWIAGMQFLDMDGVEAYIVDAMLYLVSARTAVVTGETLRVGGGLGAGI